MSPFATMFSTIFNDKTLIYEDFFMFLSIYFQSRLLQICFMWERVNIGVQEGYLLDV